MTNRKSYINKNSRSLRTKRAIIKGPSSMVNPAMMRHRKAAKLSRLVDRYPLIAADDRSNVTSSYNGEGLFKQLKMQTMSLDAKAIGDGEYLADGSSMYDGGKTDLTQFTSCTNPTFDPVHREWRSGSKLQSEVVAVLAACAELIQQNNGTESDTEYFAMLLTFMQSTDPNQLSKIAAIAYLLRLNANKVSNPVLISTFDQSYTVFMEKLEKILEMQLHSESADDFISVATKYLISAFGIVMGALPPLKWDIKTKSALVSVFLRLAGEGTSARVKYTARRAITNILRPHSTSHPAASFIGDAIHKTFRQSLIAELSKNASSRNKKMGKERRRIAIHLLLLLEGILCHMPKSVFHQLTEDVLELASTAIDANVRISSFRCICKTLELRLQYSLPIETATQLVSLLQNIQPAPTDCRVIPVWFKALIESHALLEFVIQQDGVSSVNHRIRSEELLSFTIQSILKAFTSFGGEVGINVNSKGLDELHEAISHLIRHCCRTDDPNTKDPRIGRLSNLFLEALDSSLTPQCTSIWPWILRTMEVLFSEARSSIVQAPMFERIMSNYAEIYDRQGCIHAEAFDHFFAAAVRNVGVEPLLAIVPLGIDLEAAVLPTHFHRSWLLPIINANLFHAPLGFFSGTLLLMATRLHQRLDKMPPLQRKIYSVVEHQLWDYLPKCIASIPADFIEEFPLLAPILGAALNERADLRLLVLSSIRAALKIADTNDAYGSNCSHLMEQYAKNFMPILFTLYADEPRISADNDEHQSVSGAEQKNIHLSALETIRLYSELTPPQLLSQYLSTGLTKIQNPLLSIEKKQHIMDVMITFCKRLDENSILNSFAIIRPLLEANAEHGRSLQKKAYRYLAEIYRRVNDPSLARFFLENRTFMDEHILIPKHLDNVSGPSRSWRLSIYRSHITSLTSYDQLANFSSSIITEVIALFNPAENSKTRVNAGKCLQEICQGLINHGAKEEITPSNALSRLLSKIYAHLSTSDIMQPKADPSSFLKVRSALVALNIISQQYLRLMNAGLLSELIGNTTRAFELGWGDVSTRLVAIRLVRIICTKSPDFVFEQYKDFLMKTIFSQPVDGVSSVKIRKANVLLFRVLLERIGFESLVKFAKETAPTLKTSIVWTKQIKNVEKARRRRERDCKNSEIGDQLDGKIGNDEGKGGRRSTAKSSISLSTTTTWRTKSRTGTMISGKTKTAYADSIFSALFHDDDEDNDQTVVDKKERQKSQHRNRKKRRNDDQIAIVEDSEDSDDEDEQTVSEPLDLLDRSQMLRKLVSTNSSAFTQLKQKGNNAVKTSNDEELDEPNSGPFKANKDGRLIIVDLDKKESKKSTLKRERKVHFALDKEDNSDDDSDDDSDSGSDDQQNTLEISDDDDDNSDIAHMNEQESMEF